MFHAFALYLAPGIIDYYYYSAILKKLCGPREWYGSIAVRGCGFPSTGEWEREIDILVDFGSLWCPLNNNNIVEKVLRTYYYFRIRMLLWGLRTK